VAEAAPGCDWTAAATWQFLPYDESAFPAVALARECGRRGGTFPAVFNAANEECVEAFLDGRLPFLAIVDTVAEVVSEHEGLGNSLTLADVLGAEQWARARAREITGLAAAPEEDASS
jgi:1-deoxy-D-xylulose-5-phosphate reductoisomerase